jgi:NAD+ diphosphatase
MTFVSSVQPPASLEEPAWWFLFQDDQLLVRLNGEEAQPLFVNDPEELNIIMNRSQYLGQLDGAHCFSGELGQSTTIPDDMTLLGLRRLFELLDSDMFQIAGRAIQTVNWDRDHQYCSRCGTPTETKDDERVMTCPQCGLMQYPRISPAIIVAVVRQDRILLARNARFPGGFYSVLAGFVEPGETFEECVRREVKEEVGVDVKNVRYFGSQPWPFPNSLMVGFIADHADGEIAIDNTEIIDAGWFEVTELPPIPGKISIARRLIDWFIDNYSQRPLQNE